MNADDLPIEGSPSVFGEFVPNQVSRMGDTFSPRSNIGSRISGSGQVDRAAEPWLSVLRSNLCSLGVGQP